MTPAPVDVPRETQDKLTQFTSAVIAENARQNLVAPSTLASIEQRHVADSAQLVHWATNPHGRWLDIGSGAGFPGIIIAILTGAPVTLVEPRRLRAQFLRQMAEALALPRVVVAEQRVETLVDGPFDTITARAYAPLSTIFATALHCAASATQWILPKGRRAADEVATARRHWSFEARGEPSVSDPEATIMIVRNVRRRQGRERR